ncbi:MAG: 5'/3'-nucleotidase SurE, partial [Fuerstiella sp.]|nr:5'/3'-nucleotidase SurE [Fuerstiella sp.]
SGTVAAAREAVILGVPAIAVSQYTIDRRGPVWEQTIPIVRDAVQALLERPLPAGQFWNLNLPALKPGEVPRPLQIVPQSTEPHHIAFDSSDADEGGRRYVYRGIYSQRPAKTHADVRSIFDGHVTATALQLDQSARNHSAQ